jgi:hypothetical protein
MYRYFILLALSFTCGKSIAALVIVPENVKIQFPGNYISGSTQIATSKPQNNQLFVARFFVKGDPGKRIVITAPKNQYIFHEKLNRKIKIQRFFYGCGFSKRGVTKIKNNGKSRLLCVGAKARIGAKVPSGVYSGSISFEVNYK